MKTDTLQLAIADIKGRLLAASALANIPVITERVGDVAADVAKALGTVSGRNGKIGACILIRQIIGQVENPELSVPQLKLDIAILVVENVLLNMSTTGTQMPNTDICQAVLKTLYQYSCYGISGPMLPQSPTIVPVKNQFLANEVRFYAEELAQENGATRCPAVSITLSGETLPITATMSCPLSGATILYTLDGTYPAAGAATAYTAPITITAAAKLRAVATKSGLIDSDTQFLTII